MKEFNKLFINFKNVKTRKSEAQSKKQRIIKNVDELYKNCYNDYKSNFDTDNELTENKKKKFNYKQFELDNIVSTKSDELPEQIKVSKTRFNEILSKITEAKNNGLKTNVDGEEITLDKAESLLKDINSKKINKDEFKKNTTILLMIQKR